MSLIHQALKKLEGMKGGYGTPQEYRLGRQTEWPRGYRRLVLPGLTAALLIILGITLYPYRDMLLNKEASVQVQKNPAVKKPDLTAPLPEIQPVRLDNNKKGVDLYRSGRFEEAASLFKAALKGEPQNPVFYNNLGMAYMALEKESDAKEAFKKALSFKPDYPEALNNYGAVLAKTGDHREALERYRKALALNPKYPEANLNTAISLEMLGRWKEAIAQYERFLESGGLQALNDEVKRKVLRLRSGLIAQGTGKTRH